MKKFLTLTIIAIIALIGLTVSVNAAEVTVSTEDEFVNAITGTDTTIVLNNDITLTAEKLVIPEEVKVILNLNGKTLNLANRENNYAVIIYGELTITGNGIINAPSKYGFANGGKFIIENGTFNHTHASGVYLIGNNLNNGTLIINDGTFNAKYCAVNGFENGGNVKINGGTFNSIDGWTVLGRLEINDGTFNGGTDGLILYTNTNIEINGGEFFGKDGELYVYTDNPDAKAVINDGTFNGGNRGMIFEGQGPIEIAGGDFKAGETGIIIDNDSPVEITGGTFDANVSEYLPEGIDAVKDGDVIYVGTLHTITVVETENGEVTVDKTEAVKGQKINVTIKPEEDYKLAKITINYGGTGSTIPGEEFEGNFIMEDSDATITAVFEEVEVGVEDKENDSTMEGTEEDTEDEDLTDEGTAEKEPEDKKDETPTTGSVDVVLFVSAIVAVISVAGIALVKKYTR